MGYNVGPEYAAMIIAAIVLVYSRDRSAVPSLRARLFRACLFTVMAYSVNMIALSQVDERWQAYPMGVVHALNIAQFILSPAIVVLFVYYMMTLFDDDASRLRTTFLVAAIPFLAYCGAVLTTPSTDLMYRYVGTRGFVAGRGYWIAYALSAAYLAMSAFEVFRHRTEIDRRLRPVIVSLPLLGLAMIGVMWLVPEMLLTGTTATALLLIIYLYLQNMSIHVDDLTQLQNRAAFAEMLALRFRRRQAMRIVLVSFDDFRVVNERFGQSVGDEYLREFGRFLSGLVSARDAYRYSGDEFAVVVTDWGEIDEDRVVRRVTSRLQRTWNSGGYEFVQGASIAVVDCPASAGTAAEAISMLEECVADSKRNGKGRVVYADAATGMRLKRRQRIAEALREAIASDEIAVDFQFIRSLHEESFVAAEALARLTDKELGPVSPAEFIPIAEETGLISGLSHRVLDHACRFVRELDELDTPITVSVNFSVQQFFEEDMTDRVVEIIRRNGVDASRIGIEVTESVFTDRFASVEGVMTSLRQHGIRFHLDDFGTGYSNLSKVVELDFSVVKIDRSLVQQAAASERSFGVLRALAGAFASAGIAIVLEGIESEDQNRILAEVGADWAQGFLFARPMPVGEAIQLLRA